MTISQLSVRSRRLPGKVGQRYDIDSHAVEVDFCNAHPQATQITTITVSSAANDTDYAFSVNGVEIRANSGAGATTGSIAAALAQALNESPLVRNQVIASANAAVITLESASPGLAFDVAESDANLGAPSTTQQAATADAIPFGVLCIRNGESSGPYPARQGRIASASGLVSQSVTLTHGGAEPATVTLRVDGELVEASGATAAALETALNNELPDNAIVVTVDGNDVTLAVEAAGDRFELVGYTGDITLSAEQVGDDIDRLALGVSVYAYDEEATRDGLIGYPANAGAVALKRGKIWVESPGAVSPDDPVYVQLTGSNLGTFHTTRASGRVRLTRASWHSSRAEDGLAILEADFR